MFWPIWALLLLRATGKGGTASGSYGGTGGVYSGGGKQMTKYPTPEDLGVMRFDWHQKSEAKRIITAIIRQKGFNCLGVDI